MEVAALLPEEFLERAGPDAGYCPLAAALTSSTAQHTAIRLGLPE